MVKYIYRIISKYLITELHNLQLLDIQSIKSLIIINIKFGYITDEHKYDINIRNYYNGVLQVL